MTDFLDALVRVPDLLAQHLLLAMSALVLGIILGFAVALSASLIWREFPEEPRFR